MSSKTRRLYDDMIARLLAEAGASVIDRGVDGAGHRTITFTLRNHRRTYHYPSSSQVAGRAPLNCRNRLRRIINAIPAEPASETCDVR